MQSIGGGRKSVQNPSTHDRVPPQSAVVRHSPGMSLCAPLRPKSPESEDIKSGIHTIVASVADTAWHSAAPKNGSGVQSAADVQMEPMEPGTRHDPMGEIEGMTMQRVATPVGVGLHVGKLPSVLHSCASGCPSPVEPKK